MAWQFMYRLWGPGCVWSRVCRDLLTVHAAVDAVHRHPLQHNVRAVDVQPVLQLDFLQQPEQRELRAAMVKLHAPMGTTDSLLVHSCVLAVCCAWPKCCLSSMRGQWPRMLRRVGRLLVVILTRGKPWYWMHACFCWYCACHCTQCAPAAHRPAADRWLRPALQPAVVVQHCGCAKESNGKWCWTA